MTKHSPCGLYERCFKRPIDFICAFLFLLLFWWVYAIIAILIRIKLGGPVLFTQERPGKDEKLFHLMKFRSMTEERDENGVLLPDEVRLTKFGKFLRTTSLDELPEIWNILRGDMSIVGPRPLLTEYLPWYTQTERCRHDVRPGLTGWAQVNGRNHLAWDQRFEADVYYVEHISFGFDLKILLLTIKKVLVHEDVAENTRAVEPNFAEQRREQAQNRKEEMKL